MDWGQRKTLLEVPYVVPNNSSFVTFPSKQRTQLLVPACRRMPYQADWQIWEKVPETVNPPPLTTGDGLGGAVDAGGE